MSTTQTDGLVAPSDIADMAGVSRGAVSNWRKRDSAFPEPVGGTDSNPLFERAAVLMWLKASGRTVQTDRGDGAVWAALNELRGQLRPEDLGELILALASKQKLGLDQSATSSADLLIDVERSVLDRVDQHAVERVSAAIAKIDPLDLGTTVDAVLERVARSKGKIGGEHGFAGSRTSRLLGELLSHRANIGTLYDPACGVGSAIVDGWLSGARPTRIVGHDINAEAVNMARQRAFLHGIPSEFETTDVLASDIDVSLSADTVILEPPLGLRFDLPSRMTDPRFTFGTPPKSSAETAWVQHALAHLAPGGRAYAITTPGVLFRTGAESSIREELLRRGCVEAVVALPARMLPHTSIPLVLLVLRSEGYGALDGVLFVDASNEDKPETQVPKWLRQTEIEIPVPHASVPIQELVNAESVLTPQRWTGRPQVDDGEIAQAYEQGLALVAESGESVRGFLANRGEPPVISQPAKVVSVGELISQQVIDNRLGRVADERSTSYPLDAGVEVKAKDVRDGTIAPVNQLADAGLDRDFSKPGDVLVTTMNEVRTMVDTHGGHFVSSGVHRLRVLEQEVLDPEYLALVLLGTWNQRLQVGTTIQRTPIRDLEVPLLLLTEQKEVVEQARGLSQVASVSKAAVKGASTARNAILDSVRYNINLGSAK